MRVAADRTSMPAVRARQPLRAGRALQPRRTGLIWGLRTQAPVARPGEIPLLRRTNGIRCGTRCQARCVRARDLAPARAPFPRARARAAELAPTRRKSPPTN